jgi:hypothetical protein
MRRDGGRGRGEGKRRRRKREIGRVRKIYSKSYHKFLGQLKSTFRKR